MKVTVFHGKHHNYDDIVVCQMRMECPIPVSEFFVNYLISGSAASKFSCE